MLALLTAHLHHVVITYIKNRFHPIWHLRRLSWFRRLQSLIDFPVYITDGKIKVAVFWLRDLRYLLTPHDLEERTKRSFEVLLACFKPTFCLDVGANIGSYSWRAINLTDQSEVWMFEPDEKNVWLLNRTIKQNNLDHRVKLHAAAVSNEIGSLEFLVDEASGSTGSLVSHTSNTWSLHSAYGMSKKRKVPCLTLDSFVEKLTLQRVLIKVDVEGAENHVLLGSKRVLRDIRPIILIECFELEKISWATEFDYLIRNLEEENNYLMFPRELKEKLAIEWQVIGPE